MQNPYSPPGVKSVALSISHGDAAVENGILKIKSGFKFSDYCPLCGKISSNNVKESTLYYSPRWIWIFVVLNWLILLIVYSIVKKPLKITFGYCGAHSTKRKIYNLVGSTAAIVSVIFIIMCGVYHFTLLGLIGTPLFMIGIACVIVGNKSFVIIGHQDGVFNLRGVDATVLAMISKS